MLSVPKVHTALLSQKGPGAGGHTLPQQLIPVLESEALVGLRKAPGPPLLRPSVSQGHHL